MSIQKVIEALKRQKEVKAIAIIGSHARGYADEYSDYDIAAFVSKLKPKEERENLWKELGLKIRITPADDIVSLLLNGKKVDVSYKTIDEVEFWLKKLEEGVDWFVATVSIHLQNIKIVYDPSGLLNKWKQRIKKYPKKLKCTRVLKLQAVVSLFENLHVALKREDWVYVESKLHEALQYILQAIYALNETYHADLIKWLRKDVQNFKIKPMNLWERVVAISKLGLTDENELKRKLILTKELLLETYKLCKEHLPELRMREELDNPKWFDEMIEKALNVLRSK